jgi:hypothetical protein
LVVLELVKIIVGNKFATKDFAWWNLNAWKDLGGW